MLPKDAKIIVDWIYKEGYQPDSEESTIIVRAKGYYERGFKVPSYLGDKLNQIYYKASGGGEYQSKQYVGGK